MKTLILLSSSFICLLLFSNFNLQSKTKKSKTPVVLLDKNFTYNAKTNAPLNIDTAYISKNILVIKIKYSGGCKEHSFELKSDGNFAKSNPPQISAYLLHNSNDDACRSLQSKELKFNIVSLKNKDKKPVIINLNNEQKIKYNY